MDQNNKKKNFHRHFATPGLNLYWIIIAYIIIGWFYPVIGLIALICMIGPVLTSIWRGRFWCGNVCPRGNLYDRLLSKYSPHKPIPAFVRTFGFRLFMVFGYVERNRSRILDDYRDDNYRRHHPIVYICSSYMVFVLPHGNHLVVGSSKTSATTQALHCCACCCYLPDEV